MMLRTTFSEEQQIEQSMPSAQVEPGQLFMSVTGTRTVKD